MRVEVLERFRQATDLEPSGKTAVRGPSRCTAEEMSRYVRRRNPQAPDVAALYVEIGERYGVRGDLAYCQAVYETKAWLEMGTAVVGWEAGSSRPSAGYDSEEAVEAHIRRLSGWAETDMRGRKGCWEDLNGQRYGRDVVSIWRNMLEWAGKGGSGMEKSKITPTVQAGIAGGVTEAVQMGTQRSLDAEAIKRGQAELAWLHTQGLLPQPAPPPGQAVTWAELSKLLHLMSGARPVEAGPEGTGETK